MVIRVTKKPPAFVLAASAIACSMPYVLGFLAWATGRLVWPDSPRIPVPAKWRRMYRRHRMVFRRWAQGVGIVEGSPIWDELTNRPKVGDATVRFPPSFEELNDI